MVDSSERRTRRRDLLRAVVCGVLLVAEFIAVQALGAVIDESLEPAPAWTPWLLLAAVVVGVALSTFLAVFVARAFGGGRRVAGRHK